LAKLPEMRRQLKQLQATVHKLLERVDDGGRHDGNGFATPAEARRKAG
jgi:hypothetical protein